MSYKVIILELIPIIAMIRTTYCTKCEIIFSHYSKKEKLILIKKMNDVLISVLLYHIINIGACAFSR